MGGVKAKSKVRRAKRGAGRRANLSHSMLRDECWSVISTFPSGMGSISSGMTHADAWAEAQRRYENDHHGVVVATDEVVRRLTAGPPINRAEIRGPQIPLIR